MSASMVLRISLIIIFFVSSCESRVIKEEEITIFRKKVTDMFHHAYDGYIRHAYPYDELRPLTCDGHDTWGSYSLTLIDTLDMLVIMGNNTEFQRVANLVIEKLDFDVDINVSVFETNIRVVGGLISAHLMSKRGGLDLEPGWPCSGPLLRMAEDVARRLLPAFDTPTGMPYGTVNLMYGVPTGETTVTCTAGVGTFLVEFGALSKLTGDPIFEKVAMRAMNSLYKARSNIDLVGNHIDVATGKWTALDSGIGGGVDSYFEYLVKGSIMFQNTELLDMYNEYLVSIEKYLKKDDWYMWAHMTKGSISLPIFTSLDCYWPGIQAMLGQVDKAMKSLHNFHQVWKQFGGLPEFYNIVKNEAYNGREGYPLRPELIEAALYLYQATKDPYLLEIGVDMLEAIEHISKTKCGYATVKDVTTHTLENRMESFFLAETTKYLYLLFDPDNFMHNTGNHGTVIDTPNGQCVINAGGYIYNTEAHPIDTGALYCCSEEKKEDDIELENFHDNLDLLTLFEINDNKDILHDGKWDKPSKKKYLDQINYESLKFLNDYDKSINILGNIGEGHQAVLSTKGEKFRIKEERVKTVVIDGFKGKVNDQDIEMKIVPTDKDISNGERTNMKQNDEDEYVDNLKDNCDKDGTCRKIGLELNMRKYTEEENTNVSPIRHEINDESIQHLDDIDINKDINTDFENELSEHEHVDFSDEGENGKGDKDDTQTVKVNDIKESSTERVNLKSEENSSANNDVIDEREVKIDSDKMDTNLAKNEISKNDKVSLVKPSINVKPLTTTVYQQHNTKSGTNKFKDVLYMIKRFTENYLSNDLSSGVKSIKSLHDKLKYYSLFHRKNFEKLTCEAQPFHLQFSVTGEMFIND